MISFASEAVDDRSVARAALHDRTVAGDPGARMPTLVLVHGLFSSPLEFSLIARLLRLRGVPFELLEVPGYTRGGATRSTWRQWVAAAGTALDQRFAPGEPIVLGGLCVGGAIAAALTEQPRCQRICGLAMLSPTLDIDGWGLTRWRHLRRLGYLLGLDRWISIPERAPFGIKNEKMRKWVAQELEKESFSSVGPARLPLWGLKQAERLATHVRLRLAELDVPLLVLHAREDEITSLGSVARWVVNLGTRTQLVVLDDSYHMITIDNDRRRVAEALCEFTGALRDGLVRSAAAACPERPSAGLRTGVRGELPSLTILLGRPH